MTTYISLLRGINVAGQKLIKMAELRQLYQKLALENVQSYIQSGNLVFTTASTTSSEAEANTLATKINQGIAEHYQFDVPVTVLSAKLLIQGRESIPFDDIDLEMEGSKVMLCFLSKVPTSSAIALLTPYLKPSERIAIIDKVLYMHCQEGFGLSKLPLKVIEKKLQLSGTARNVKTVNKLITLAEQV